MVVDELFYLYFKNLKALISYTVTAQLICAFVLSFAKSRFSHGAVHIYVPMCHLVNHNGQSRLTIFVSIK